MGAFNFNNKDKNPQKPVEKEENTKEIQQKIDEYNDTFKQIYGDAVFDSTALKQFCIDWWLEAIEQSKNIKDLDKGITNVLTGYSNMFIRDLSSLNLINFNESINKMYYDGNDKLREIIKAKEKNQDYINGFNDCLEMYFHK